MWKRDEQGNWVWRARLVIKEIAVKRSLDYFAPTTSTTTSRVLSVIGCKRGMKHFELDVSNAFLHASP
eukprot:4102990-Amphidinium_carterae.2